MQVSGPGAARSWPGRVARLCEVVDDATRALEVNTIEDIGEKTDLVYRQGIAFGLVVFEQKDVFSVGDVLQVEIDGLAQLVFFTVRAVPEFGVQSKVVGQSVRKIM